MFTDKQSEGNFGNFCDFARFGAFQLKFLQDVLYLIKRRCLVHLRMWEAQ